MVSLPRATAVLGGTIEELSEAHFRRVVRSAHDSAGRPAVAVAR